MNRNRHARRVAIGVLALATYATADAAFAGLRQVVPDSSCANESTFKSTAGEVKALLKVINKTDESMQLIWLDYDGKRVFYQPVPPQTTITQQTFLTHPWIVTSSTGTCYRLVVMNSQAQTVEVKSGDASGIPVEPAPTTSTSTTIASSTGSSRSPRPAPPQSSSGADDSSTRPIVIGTGAAVAAGAAGGAAWWATHRKPKT